MDVQVGDRLVHLGHGPAELGAEIPAVGEAHTAAREDEVALAFHHDDEVFLNQSTGGVERMKGRVEFDLVESIGMVVAEMVDDCGRDLDALRLDVVKHAESGVGCAAMIRAFSATSWV